MENPEIDLLLLLACKFRKIGTHVPEFAVRLFPICSVRVFGRKRNSFFSVDIMKQILRQAFAYAISWA